ncbi:hypothetical protein [Roseococcus sp.]|uniref:hypothetical protein n=1 Tax=Roseococcus sp. TaxID=2109646 RepID=UPI003BA9794B
MFSTFKGLALAGLVAIAPVALTAMPAAAQPFPQRQATCNTDFVAANNTGAPIGWVHARRAGKQAWGPEMLGRGVVVMPGAVARLHLPGAGVYDVAAIGKDGRAYEARVSACDVVLLSIR